MKREMFIILLVFVLLSSCTERTEGIPISTSEKTSTSDHWTTPTETYSVPTLTMSPSPTMSKNLTPSSMPEITNTMTMTPHPTLSAEEAEYTFRQWLLGSEDCQLPCWAGIIPGETTWEEARYLVEPVLEISQVIQNGTCFNDACSGFSWSPRFIPFPSPIYGSILELNSNVVTDIGLHLQSTDFQLSPGLLFENYGLPQRILMIAGYYEIDNYVDNIFIMYYPEYDFVVRYYRSGWLSGGNIWSCGPFELTQLEIRYLMDSDWTDDEILLLLEGEIDPELYVPYHSLEEITEYSIESFAEMFIDDPNACFEIITNY